MTQTVQSTLFAPLSEPPAWELDDEADRLFAEVVFNRPLEELFLYEVPYPLRDQIEPGKRVSAPFGRGNQGLTGYCVGLRTHTKRTDLKKLSDVLDDHSLVGPVMLELARWIAEYYCCALGQVLDGMLPAGVRGGAGTRAVTVFKLGDGVREQLAAEKTAPSTSADGPAASITPKQRRVLELLVETPDGLTSRELARRAQCGIGVVRSLQARGLLASSRQRVLLVDSPELPRDDAAPVSPNPDQLDVLGRIEQAIAAGGYHAMLLHGVTGSGKTEIYLRAIEQVVRAGRQAIVLVPEISLTPQTIRRFRSRFPHIAVLHSHLGDAERHQQWRRIASGEVQVVVGVRSAIFAPTPQLGLIVLDEEHESTFKQDTTPRYHAREVGIQRARLERAPILLGSATPSLESWHRAQTGEYELLELPRRVLSRPLPAVKLVDLRFERPQQQRRGALSPMLANAMRHALQNGGQVILLLNRRGFSTFIHCWRCGHVEKCKHCDISMVFHRDRHVALCHFCDYETPPPERCPQCKDAGLSYQGLGTERLEQEVRARFPEATCARMDTDTMRGRGSHEAVLSKFRQGETQILLGTQMIAKGLDFPGVTLVGVVNADTALHLPDFRAAERTFQLVAQVAGRTGRGDREGRVLVQTLSPDHAAIQAAAGHDYAAFVAAEMPHRRDHGYPPFGRLARIIVRSPQEAGARAYIDRFAARLKELAAGRPQPFDLRVLGPAPAPVFRLKSYFRYHMQVQVPLDLPLHSLLRPVLAELPPPNRVEVAVDVDPISML